MLNFSEIFNYPIYIVGGAVRDRLLGLPMKDIDLASALHPEEFIELCDKLGFKTYPTGIKHGTVSVRIKGEVYEHTTFRRDVSCDGRNASISFSDTIEEDLSRRDFTMNAIALLGDEYIDLYNGQEDLKNGLIRSVGDASERFQEDYLRIVRAARFAARFSFSYDSEIILAAKKYYSGILKHVSFERITDEFKKAQKQGTSFLKCSEELYFLQDILPEFYNLSDDEKKYILKEVQRSENFDEIFYFAALFLRLGDEEKVLELCKRFKLSNHLRDQLLDFKRYAFEVKNFEAYTATELRKFILSIKKDHLRLIEYYYVVLNDLELPLELIEINKNYNKVIESIKSPLINGSLLMKKGLKAGSEFKEILEKAGSLQAEGLNKEEIFNELNI